MVEKPILRKSQQEKVPGMIPISCPVAALIARQLSFRTATSFGSNSTANSAATE